jgi:phosphoribosylaminoimidazolecarboxamide formyltransferase/IMP cyclohydrolase
MLAYAGDTLSAFGGVLGLNRPLNMAIAEAILAPSGFKLDAIVAPSIDADALQALTTKKKWGANVIVIEAGSLEKFRRDQRLETRATQHRDVRTIPGGILVQSPDVTVPEDEFSNLKTVTKREPTAAELEALKFAWILCKHVKSNAIVLGKGNAIVGVGAGQMSRVDSVEIAIKKAADRVRGSVLASDAFFPFPDGPEAAAKAGVTAIIQPGGSVKDADVIQVCDQYNLAMVMTGVRHFRH